MNQISCVLNEIDSQTAAAWVQAIGSIFAIAIAIWVAYKQHANALELEEKRQQDKKERFLDASISLGYGLVIKLKTLEGWCKSQNPNEHNFDFLSAEVRSIKSDIDSIQLFEISNFEMLLHVSMIKTFSSIAVELVSSIIERQKATLQWVPSALEKLNEVIPEFDNCINELIDLKNSGKISNLAK